LQNFAFGDKLKGPPSLIAFAGFGSYGAQPLSHKALAVKPYAINQRLRLAIGLPAEALA
jgi:hypothetical protein